MKETKTTYWEKIRGKYSHGGIQRLAEKNLELQKEIEKLNEKCIQTDNYLKHCVDNAVKELHTIRFVLYLDTPVSGSHKESIDFIVKTYKEIIENLRDKANTRGEIIEINEKISSDSIKKLSHKIKWLYVFIAIELIINLFLLIF